MLQDSISKIKYLLVFALMMVLPMQAFAGASLFDPIDQTDTGADRLVYFYDTIGRSTFLQVTNTSDDLIVVHVQVWNASNNCEEFNFDLPLTAGDTNIADVEDILGGPGSPDLSNSTGFVTISTDIGPSSALIGMFRIIDDSGYEYRTNAADSENNFSDDFAEYVLNFNDVNGNNLSDVVGLTYADIGSANTFASPNLGTQFGVPDDQPVIFDEFELGSSCSPAVFACQEGGTFSLNKGIDNSIPNSQGFPRICNRNTLNLGNSAGWLRMPFYFHVCLSSTFVCDATDQTFFDNVYFVGFLGLNNGTGTGSMDSWWGFSFAEVDGQMPPTMGTAAP